MLLRPHRSRLTRMSGLLLVMAVVACLLGMHAQSGSTLVSGGNRTAAAVSTSFSPQTSAAPQVRLGPGSQQRLTDTQADSTPMLMATMGECVAVIAALSLLLLLPQRDRLTPRTLAVRVGSRTAATRSPVSRLLRACTVLQI